MRRCTTLKHYAFVFEKDIEAKYDRAPSTATLELSQNTVGFRTLQLNAVSYSQGPNQCG